MQFGRIGDLHTVSSVTGPSHVWLGLVFAQEPKAVPDLVERPAIGDCQHEDLDAGKILTAIREGIEDANVGLYVNRAEYVVNDSPRYDLYRDCAKSLAKRAGGHPQ